MKNKMISIVLTLIMVYTTAMTAFASEEALKHVYYDDEGNKIESIIII